MWFHSIFPFPLPLPVFQIHIKADDVETSAPDNGDLWDPGSFHGHCRRHQLAKKF
jgi:hypothetical protein